jgi:hypothetical protein
MQEPDYVKLSIVVAVYVGIRSKVDRKTQPADAE